MCDQVEDLIMGKKCSTVDADAVEKVINFVLNSQKNPSSYPTFPWHIARAIKNRLENGRENTGTITVNNSHMRMIINGATRIFDEEDVNEDTKQAMKRVNSKVDSRN